MSDRPIAAAEPLERRTLFTTAALLADLNPTPVPIDLVPGAVVGDAVYCARSVPTARYNQGELWRTDGTSAGTQRLEAYPSAPTHLTAFGTSLAYMVADRLYVTDAHAAGDARAVHTFTDPYYEGRAAAVTLAAVGSRLYVDFAPGDASGGLYVSDGTAAGTAFVQPNLGLVEPNQAANVALYGDALPHGTPPGAVFGTDAAAYFAAVPTDGSPVSVYRTDGTPGGTVAIIGTTAPKDLAPLDGGAAVLTAPATGVTALSVVAPAAASAAVVRTFPTRGAALEAGVTAGGRYVFAVPDTATDTYQVWATDGTSAGTVELTAGLISAPGAYELTAADGKAFFLVANLDGTTSLAVTDGTVAGTAVVRTFDRDQSLTTVGGRPADGPLFFQVASSTLDSGSHAQYLTALYRSDGTAAGTVDLADGPYNVAFDEAFPLATGTAAVVGVGPLQSGTTAGDPTGMWVTDGVTPGGGVPFRPAVTEAAASDPTPFAVAGAAAYFAAAPAGGPSPTAVYRTDGTATVPLVSFADDRGVSVRSVTASADRAYFVRVDPVADSEQLWTTDGTPAGTVPLPVTAPPDGLTNLSAGPNGGLFLAVGDGNPILDTSSLTLWHTDGTAGGTAAVVPLPTGLRPGYAGAAYDGSFLFVADQRPAVASPVLYRTDGTAAGTTVVTALPPDATQPSGLAVAGGKLFVAGSGGLFVTDGTAAGTAELPVTSTQRAYDGYADDLTVTADGTLYFTYSDLELWRTDGTASGTVRVYVPPTPTGSAVSGDVSHLAAAGSRLFFEEGEPSGTPGNGLWSTDGTTAGTAQVFDATGAAVVATGATAVGRTVYFTRADAAHGTELWQTDGTPGDTALAADVDPGVAESDVHNLAAVGSQLLFAADDGTHGVEPFRAVASPPPTAALAAAVTPVNGAATVPISVTYAAAGGVLNPLSLAAAGAVTVTAPDGTATAATVAAVDPATGSVTYAYAAPGGKLTAADDGTYVVAVAGGVANADGTPVAPVALGTFAVAVPTAGPSFAVTAAVVGRPAAVGGTAGVARVTIRNAGTVAANGTVTVQLLVATGPTADGGTPVATVAVPVRLRPGQRRTTAVPFTYPAASADGTRYVVAVVDADGKVPQVDATADTAASAAVAYRHASVDLSAAATAARGRSGRRTVVVFRVHNGGSVTATGTATFALTLVGGSLATAVTLPPVTARVSVRAGATRAVPVPFTVPAGLVAGSYALAAVLAPTTSPADADAADKSVDVALRLG